MLIEACINFPVPLIHGLCTLSIGSDVTNESPNGPVTFCNGNIKISANDVEINGETTIQEGTSFEITTEY